MSGVGRGIALALGGAAVAGVAGLGAALIQGGREAASYQQITDQVAQTIRSTGEAAGVSVEGLKEYAGQLESQSGVDEELILSGQNVLLTFTKVRNEAGKGNDIFNQASQAALNLSTTMGGDLAGANTLVGKALNDPIKGMSALSRAGVQLTAEQKEQIKTMVASGDTMGAQKIILGELEKQFGGAAEAAGQGLTGSIARAKDAFSDLFRGIAERGLPTLTAAAEFFGDKLAPAIGGVFDILVNGDYTGALSKAFGIEEDSPIVGVLFRIREGAIAVFDALKVAGGFIADNIVPILAGLGVVAGGALLAALGALAAGVVALISPFVLVVAAIAAAVAGAVYAYQHFEGFRNVVDQVAAFLVGTVVPAFIQLAGTVQEDIGAAVAYVVSIWPQISAVIQTVLAVVQTVVQTYLAVVVGLWNTFGDTILGLVRTVWNLISSTIGNMLSAIRGVVQIVMGLITGDWGRAWDGIKTVLGAVWEQIKALVGAALGVLKGIVGLGLDGIGAAWGLAWDGIKALLSRAWDAMKSATNAGLSAVVGFVAGLPGRVGSALAGLGGLLSGLAAAAWGAFRAAAATKVSELMTLAAGIGGRVSDALSGLPGLLVNSGRELIGGLIRGVTDKLRDLREKMAEVADTIKGFLPGSPVREGPLTSWNNGGAGSRLMGMLADGITRGSDQPVGALRRTLGDLADLTGMQTGDTAFVMGRLGSGSTGGSVATPSVEHHVHYHADLSGVVDPRIDEATVLQALTYAGMLYAPEVVTA